MIPVLIVPTLVHYNLLQNMLNSIDVPVNEIIVIDNGGKLKNIHCEYTNKISIISLPRNLGVAASWNLGIKLTPMAEWWMIASDDITFGHGRLQSIINSNFDTFIFDKKRDRPFSAFGIHENIINKIGLFNEYFYPGIGEEVDYIEKLYKNNITVYNIANLFDEPNGGANTLNIFGLKNPSGERLEVVRNALLYDNKNKKDGWDLDYRRYIENILND